MRPKSHFVVLFTVLLSIASRCPAQTSSSKNAAAIQLRLQKLNTLGTVLYFAAHPDDENTRLLAWLANEKKYRTGYLSLTRGDGGQNLIGTEQAEELGLLRTQELLAARRDDGGEQFFSTANDFGFSKTFDETFKIWGKEKILADAVWVIRNFQPDIIITRFPGDPRAGHGHHQASSLIAQEAFAAAADPTRFPEQLQYVKPWKTERILWNTHSFGNTNTLKDGQLIEDLSQYNTLLGRSYGEIAAISRTNHKSQGFGATPQRGEMKEYFETLGGTAPKTALFDGINTGWSRISHSEKIQKQINQLIDEFDSLHPERSLPLLISLLNELEQIEGGVLVQQKTQEVKDLILDCAGIWIACQADRQKYALGSTVEINTQIVVQTSELPVHLKTLKANHTGDVIKTPLSLEREKLEQIKISYEAQTLTQPYWLALPHSLGSFEVADQTLIGQPEAATLPAITATLDIGGKELEYVLPITYSYNDPVRGEVKNPIVVAPPITLNLDQKALVFNGKEPKHLELSFIANKDHVKAEVRPVLPKGWTIEPAYFNVDLQQLNDEFIKEVTIYPPTEASISDSIRFNLVYQDRVDTARSLKTIQHDHVPQINWFPQASAKLSKIETGVSAKHIGYLPGAGDLVAQSLREIGLKVDILTESDIMHQNLSQYDAIITGIRIYNVDDRIRYLQAKLMQYVENGGTLVEQYNVNGGLKTNNIGPYPFQIGRDRVTDEQATVTFVAPEHPVLQYPNKITEADFDGWIQERGLYFATEADKHYVQPLSMHDPDEPANTGSLLVTKYGKGKYVYTSLAFFRELPAGVPGAYRLFVNLLAKENN